MHYIKAKARLRFYGALLTRYLPPALFALAIFIIDLASNLPGAVAVLFTAVILLIGRSGSRTPIIIASTACALLALVAFLLTHPPAAFGDAHIRLLVSLTAIYVATALALRGWSARAEFELQARLLDLTHDTVIVHDGLYISYWNDGAAALYGYSRKEAIGSRCRDLLRTRLPVPKAEIDRIIESQGAWSGHIVRTRADGSEVIVHARWTERRRGKGLARQLIETSTDVTEHLRLNQRYRSIFNAVGFAIWESDWSRVKYLVERLQASGDTDVEKSLLQDRELLQKAISSVTLTDINDAALELFKVPSREAVVGTNFTAIHTSAAEHAFAAAVGRLAEGRDRVEVETQGRTLDGEAIEALIRVNLPADSQDDWKRILLTAVDLTERNAIQARLDQTLAQLSHGARISMLGELAASIAHEVNQPMAAMVTFGEAGRRWLAKDPVDQTEVSNCLEQILANGKRATEVIHRVRSLAQRSPVQSAPLSIAAVAAESAQLMSREFRTHAILFRDEIAHDTPDVLGDRIQLQQVVINLLMNGVQALAAMPAERRNLSLAVYASGSSQVTLEVRDNGPGISPEQAGRLFQSFASTRAEGLGMGLFISRNIIESHNGRIKLFDRPEGGATAMIVLPSIPAAAP